MGKANSERFFWDERRATVSAMARIRTEMDADHILGDGRECLPCARATKEKVRARYERENPEGGV